MQTPSKLTFDSTSNPINLRFRQFNPYNLPGVYFTHVLLLGIFFGVPYFFVLVIGEADNDKRLYTMLLSA